MLVLLADIDYTDRRVLADKADQLQHSKQSHAVVAAVDEHYSDDTAVPVAALRRCFHGDRQSGGN